MSYLDNINMMANWRGSSKADSMAKGQANLLNKAFKDSPYYKKIKIQSFDNSLREVDVRITQEKVPGVDDYYSSGLLFRPYEPFKIGEYAIINNDNWLIVDSNFLDDLMQKAYIELCNTTLKWINDKGEIKEYGTHVKPRYTLPISETTSTNEMFIPSQNLRVAMVQANVDTLSIKRDQRFIFDNKAWKCVGTDAVTYVGMVYVSLFEQEINNATDNTTLRIADYYTKLANYALSILNGSTSSITVGSTLQLNTQVMNNGTVVTGENITYSSSDTSVATVDANGVVTGVSNGSVTVTASLANNPSITATISVNVSAVVTNSYSVSITSTSATPTEIKNGQSKTYNVVISNNGTQITDGSQTVVWSIYGDDQVSSTTLATITSQTGSSCIVKNNNANSGYVQLKATLGSDGTVVGWLRIQMKSLI